MATFKPYVSSYKRSDGTYNVQIRVIHNRQTLYISTPFYVTNAQVTKGKKIKDNSILDKVESKIHEYRKKVDEMGFAVENVDANRLVALLRNDSEKVDFMLFWRSYIEEVNLGGSKNTALSYLNAYRSFKAFYGDKPLYANDITKNLFYDYYKSLSKLSANAQRSYIRSLRKAYKEAQIRYNNEDDGLIPFRYNVFDLIKLPAQTSNKSNAMQSVKDMQAIIDVPYSGTWSFDFAKDMFILSFCCLGTNMADFLTMKKSQYSDGIITYIRKKTGKLKNKDVEMKIKLTEPAKIIIEKYSGDPYYLIDFRGHARTNGFCRRIHYTFQKAGLEERDENKTVSEIGHYKGNYTFYANRHSMASFSRNECDADFMLVHKMLNHTTPQAFKTTDTYIRDDYKVLWDANDKLMALFDWSFYTKQKKEA